MYLKLNKKHQQRKVFLSPSILLDTMLFGIPFEIQTFNGYILLTDKDIWDAKFIRHVVFKLDLPVWVHIEHNYITAIVKLLKPTG